MDGSTIGSSLAKIRTRLGVSKSKTESGLSKSWEGEDRVIEYDLLIDPALP
jgi:lambda repressor-like predicted transcriptional regulator